MTATLRIVLTAASLLFMLVTVYLVSRDRLQLKYSLLWLLMSFALLLSALFPGIVSRLSSLLGVGLSSNFVFLVGLAFSLALLLSLTVIASKQANAIRTLTQRIALLEWEQEREYGKAPSANTQAGD